MAWHGHPSHYPAGHPLRDGLVQPIFEDNSEWIWCLHPEKHRLYEAMGQDCPCKTENHLQLWPLQEMPTDTEIRYLNP